MLIGIDNVIGWLRTNGTPYWNVKTGSGEKASLIYSARPEDDAGTLALQDSEQKLKQCLDTLAPGNYAIQAWTTPGQKKNWAQTNFQITNAHGHVPQQVAGIGNVGMYNNTQPDFNRLIEEALDKERKQNKITTLEAELAASKAKVAELTAELDSAQIRIGKRFEQVAAIFDGYMPGKTDVPALSGSQADDEEKVANLMERWASKDPNFIHALNGIVGLVENNPTKYEMAKKML